ncbi:mannitol-1-phosphate 5-dehydrogenase [Lactococcus hodotermopsidis]|uniref:Mannitol-1-phosphate 5-dehydrogenase n=1 Tax=Pseudolactococcus hodotermopsidis TaxID=2709157 RepID=A0A6A0BDT9_9LACT|nr:mannitol-1-phosphate 5-dehydrogenase [Lactococcus hodotermopsidis]GFH42845.1 mannitol-1-phosphate 5-dehydrogenase [Lactococcus hodotermopsidis]
MKKAVHFGAGNIGRGFIGEILHKNGFEIIFVDVNETVIEALNARGAYEIELAEDVATRISIDHVSGINNAKNPTAVIEAIKTADIVTTAIGPNILPFIAELIAKGIQARQVADITKPLDFIACENMIGGSEFLKTKVAPCLTDENLAYVDRYIGFPNAAVDRIVPGQMHKGPLFVVVEPFSEWVVDESQLKNAAIHLDGVHYARDLEPFIERKLFSVNTGHATVAYTGFYYGFATIDTALADGRVMTALINTQKETRALLLAKWDLFDADELVTYHEKIRDRFANPHLSDEISRVARTPIRKLGYDERFIRPIRELNDRNLSYDTHLATTAKIFKYTDATDPQAVELQNRLATENVTTVIESVTGVTDSKLVTAIKKAIDTLS